MVAVIIKEWGCFARQKAKDITHAKALRTQRKAVVKGKRKKERSKRQEKEITHAKAQRTQRKTKI